MPATDQFVGIFDNGNGYTGGQPAVGDVDFAKVSRAIYVGGAGAATFIMADGTSLTFAAIPAGTTIRMRCSRVVAAGLVASSIVALW